jgi:hypothetical protein
MGLNGLVIPVLNSGIDRILLIKREIEIVLSLLLYRVFSHLALGSPKSIFTKVL